MLSLALMMIVSAGTNADDPGDPQQASPRSAQQDSPQVRQTYEHFALIHPGDPQRGRQLFLDEQRTKCTVCHQVAARGGDLGPDLSHIGGKFDRPHLIESLLEPSRQIVETYRTSVFVTNDGQVKTGIVKNQSAHTVTLVDADGTVHSLATSDIEQRKESSVSLMPQGLTETLTREEFTDLIAYLETLRTGGKLTPGAGVTGAIQLPDGFEIETIATALTGCTALETTNDGRILVCEQTGSLWVVKNGELLREPMLRLSVDPFWERGLIGVTVDPHFPQTPYIYVCYVAKEPFSHHRVSRFEVDGDVALAGSEKVLLVGDDQSKLGGTVPAGHQGGGLHFGVDEKLYIAIGEQTAQTPAQELDSLLGKMLRINSDGTIPDDNPFLAVTQGKYQSIWAIGLRNPFTFAFRLTDGQLLINDVGGTSEEINRGVAGENYGWPVVDHGPTADPRFRGPVHYYPQASISGGDFAADDLAWPQRFRGKYFFADFVHGWIRMIDPAHTDRAHDFVSGLRRPVDLRFANDGSLYVLLRNAWVIDNKFQPDTGSLLRIRYRGPAVAGADRPRIDDLERSTAERSTSPDRGPLTAALPNIDVWYGTRQRFGHRGIPQKWINVLGRVEPADSIMLDYRLNGSPPNPLSVGPNFTRLAAPGDFNIEIAISDLRHGDNLVTITATDTETAKTAVENVTVQWNPASDVPLPFHIDWSRADSIHDVAQVVDGRWELTSQGVRSVEPYYDRVIAFGDRSWSDYEIETTVVFHGRRLPGAQDGGRNVIHAALASRWPGHDHDPKQPHVKWYPLGATAEFMLTDWPEECRWRILGGASRERHAYEPRGRAIVFEQHYQMKHRVATRDDSTTEYRVKLWPHTSPEPAAWDLVAVETPDDVTHGGALLIAHYTDVTFGNLTVRR